MPVEENYFHLQYFCMLILTTFFCAALDLLQTAIEKAGFTEKVVVGMDVAASEFHREGKYDLDFKSPPDSQRYISAEELAGIYQSFVNNYPGRHRFVIFYATFHIFTGLNFSRSFFCWHRSKHSFSLSQFSFPNSNLTSMFTSNIEFDLSSSFFLIFTGYFFVVQIVLLTSGINRGSI